MKTEKILLFIITLFMTFGIVAFRAHKESKKGQGTLYTKSNFPCHLINCVRTTGSSTCNAFGQIYTDRSCYEIYIYKGAAKQVGL